MRQTELVTVKAPALMVGDRIPVGFAMYGDILCPIVLPPETRGSLVDVCVRIGADGPAHYTVVRADETFTVVR